MALDLLYIALGFILLSVGAQSLVRGSTGIAVRMGISALVIGLTIVAFGTGSPELALSIEAASSGEGSLALGNVIGSNISNICLVLGISAMVAPLAVCDDLVQREMPVLIGVSVLLVLVVLDGSVGRVEGILLVLGAVGYTAFSYIRAKIGTPDAQIDPEDEPSTELAEDIAEEVAGYSVLAEGGLILVGLVGLVGGAQLLLKGAVAIASGFGISEIVIGLTVIALGTSLPELATGIAAARRGEPDIAFGSVIGSNVFNILAVLGVAAAVSPITIEGMRAGDLVVLVGTTVALLFAMMRGSVLSRVEGFLLVLTYGVYIASLAL